MRDRVFVLYQTYLMHVTCFGSLKGGFVVNASCIVCLHVRLLINSEVHLLTLQDIQHTQEQTFLGTENTHASKLFSGI